MATTRTVLIVEDEAPLRAALVERFTRAGYRVLQAADGPEAQRVALAAHPDAILLDLLLPKLNGLAVAKEIRQDPWGQDVPIVILTNVDEAPEVAEALEAGIFDYLVKANESLDAVVEKVERRLAANPPARPEGSA